MDKELRGFRELILWLYDTHKSPDEYENNDAISIYFDLPGIELFPDRYTLERYLPTEDNIKDEFPKSKYIYLDPVKKGTVMMPLLRLKYDFGRHPPEVRLRLHLFLKHNDRLKAFGFRYESPEGSGMHHYYHAQIIKDVGPKDARSFWLPDDQPAFPIDTDNPIGLLVALLVSLYGIGYLGKIKVKVKDNVVKECIQKMFCHSIPELIRYWRITMRDNSKPEIVYRTTGPNQDFIDHIQGRFTGCTWRNITRSEYDSTSAKYKNVFPE
jgi:hypothetical protein